MKRISMVAFVMFMMLGYTSAVGAHAASLLASASPQESANPQVIASPQVTVAPQASANSQDAFTLYADMGNQVHCSVNQVLYVIDREKKCATAVWATADTAVLEIPSVVNLNGLSYPVTKFDINVEHQGFLFMDSHTPLGSYEEIKLPDSVTEVNMQTITTVRHCKKINIPKHARASLTIDIDDIVVEIPADHDYYTLKDNMLYDKKDSSKIYYVLSASGTVRIPEGVEEIGTLLRNNKIKKLILPSSLKKIGRNFARGTKMKQIDLSATKLQTIPTYAFRGAGIQTIKLPRTLLEIDSKAFEACKLKKVTIPNKVTRIGLGAFQNCSKLKAVTLGKKVETLEMYAFLSTSVQEITLPASVKKIAEGALPNAKKLRKVTFLHRKKLPDFDKNAPMIECRAKGNRKIAFRVQNKKMKSLLNQKLKKEKQKDKKHHRYGIKKWKITVV